MTDKDLETKIREIVKIIDKAPTQTPIAVGIIGEEKSENKRLLKHLINIDYDVMSKSVIYSEVEAKEDKEVVKRIIDTAKLNRNIVFTYQTNQLEKQKDIKYLFDEMNVDYIFDLEDFAKGQINIMENDRKKEEKEVIKKLFEMVK